MAVNQTEGTDINAVEDLGISNDGSVDVTDLINYALNGSEPYSTFPPAGWPSSYPTSWPASGFGRVYLPAGNYLIGNGQFTPNSTGSIELILTNPSSTTFPNGTPFGQYSAYNGKRLCGAGPNTTFLTVNNDSAPGISIFPNAANPNTVPPLRLPLRPPPQPRHTRAQQASALSVT